MNLHKILLVGGTHGNEPTGAYLLEKWRRYPGILQRDGLETELLFANPKAFELGRRYVDRDLNRCFLERDLADSNRAGHEDKRAREVSRLYGPANDSPPDLIIDMHTTTANMGITLICNDTPDTLRMAAAVKESMVGVNIYCIEKSDRIDSCLRSLARHGIGIEIGPVPQNVLRHEMLEQMSNTVSAILDVACEVNSGSLGEPSDSTPVYLHLEDVPFPKKSDCPDPVIHRDLEGKNYLPIKEGTPVFIGSGEQIVRYSGPEEACPVFINEAAYYEKGIALSLSRRTPLSRFLG